MRLSTYVVRVYWGTQSFNIRVKASCEVNAMARGYKAAKEFFPQAKRHDLNVIATQDTGLPQ